jgi:hypothetical protein
LNPSFNSLATFAIGHAGQAHCKETCFMKLQRKSLGLTALAIAGVTLMAMAIETPVASADVEIWNTPSGSVDSSSDPVSAQATFNISSGKIVITLSNLQTGIHAAGQVVSDLSFTTVNANNLLSSVMASSSAQEVTVSKSGYSLDSTVSTGWGYARGSGHLTDLVNGDSPQHTIIGPSTDNPNSSITKNHNPFLYESATFTITGAGITSSTTIASATFSFGTSAGDDVRGTQVVTTTTPEPSTIAIAGLGALGFIGYGLRRRLKK